MPSFARAVSTLGLSGPKNSQKFALSGRIRALNCSEKHLFCEHLLRLDPETRRNRFAMPADDAFMRSYAETSFALDPVILGYFEGGTLRGIAELRALPEPQFAEAAFCVEKAWRRKGIGTQLMSSLLDEAGGRGIERIYISCLASNLTMQALARKFSARFTYQAGDMIGLIMPPKPKPLEIFRQGLYKLLSHSNSSVPSAS